MSLDQNPVSLEIKSPIKVDLKEYEMLQTLGAGIDPYWPPGSFGRVRLAKHKSSGNYVAIKALKKAEIIRIKQVDHVISENNILGAISHPFIVVFCLSRLICTVSVKITATCTLFSSL